MALSVKEKMIEKKSSQERNEPNIDRMRKREQRNYIERKI